MDLSLDTPTAPPVPLKKCIECGDEWITDQTEVTCLVTGNKVILVVIDSNPIDVDDFLPPNPCKAKKHTLTPENWYRYQKKTGRTEQGCNECRRERNRAAKQRQFAKRRAARAAEEAEKLAYLLSVRNNG